ncbi:MAG TPA: hypothetical protein VLW06_08410 [Terriglobales bacterium]|nr:hypothetical protein [Terriglobales bacterium]
MNLQLSSMAIAMPAVHGHPNREPFRGVLTLVDTPSDKPPAGSRGHRVILTRAAAERALPSLLGMALDYSPSFDKHDARRKVGVITRAEIVAKELELSGYLYAKDFPELVRQIESGLIHASSQSRKRPQNPLGMSYEIADASVADTRAKIWTLTRVTFTGAAILRRDKAAYRDTWIELE